MFASFRRWQSIDLKLPLLASGLVVLTALVVAITAHFVLEGALLDAAGRRLFNSANLVGQMVQRPPAGRITDSAGLATDATLRAFARGKGSHDKAYNALALILTPRDTTKVFAALFDSTGSAVLAYRAHLATADPKWAAAAIAAGEITGDTLSVGPIESASGMPAISMVRPLRDTTATGQRLLGYHVETRTIGGVRTMRQFRGIMGDGVSMVLGQPGVGVWTDLERIAATPPILASRDSIVVYETGIGAFARVPGTKWMVWLSQPKHAIVAPARTILWSMVPMGFAIALIAAALMWRMTRHITHPIAQLTLAAENIASDNGATRMQPTVLIPAAADEVARLRYAFERMARRVSDRQTLELQLRHAQKMEAVGSLAGGIAHDFNNLLTAIRSYSDLLLDDIPAWDSKHNDVLEIRKAAERAAALTAQLLAYSRKQMLQPRVVDPAAVLTDVEHMLRRTLVEDIDLQVHAPAGLWPVRVDRGQLEQVIVNLAVNARDSMPAGGTLRISAMNDRVLEPIETKHHDVPAGEYVAIRVTDTGTGMEPTTLNHVFEPFFTTKPVGQGTGLGLATAHGIIAQSGGYVTVDSEVGRGTTFTLYLPRVQGTPDLRNSGGSMVVRGSNETILLVEDEPSVRTLAQRVLTKTGYRVLEAGTPSDAMRLAELHATEIQLIVSDVVMPEMSGPTFVARIAETCPQARVLFISGYTDSEVIGRGLSNPGMMLLQKPFSAQELVERVRLVLDENAVELPHPTTTETR